MAGKAWQQEKEPERSHLHPQAGRRKRDRGREETGTHMERHTESQADRKTDRQSEFRALPQR